ncbi:MAG TPA: 2-dehydropantoate 2-reductase [Gaiellaceae bacterium]
MKSVCIVGGGVIGSLFAAHLSRVADVWLLCRRREHARAVERRGLRVSGRADFLAHPHATCVASELPPAELAILATKATDIETAVRELGAFLDRGTVMTVQNGLGAEEAVRRQGDWPVISAVTFMSGTKHADDHVEYVLDTPTWLGPFDGASFALAEQAAALIVSAGLKAEALPDLRPAQWSKLIFNATVNAVAALTGLPHDFHFAALAQPFDLGWLVRALVQEGEAVAASAGVELHDDPWQMNVLATKRGSAHYPSMLEDVRGKRRTEVDQINGSLVREARRHGVQVPLHEALYALVRGRERSYAQEPVPA